jgi:hypothetical protein
MIIDSVLLLLCNSGWFLHILDMVRFTRAECELLAIRPKIGDVVIFV